MKVIKDSYTNTKKSKYIFNSSIGVYEENGSEIYLKHSCNTALWYEFL